MKSIITALKVFLIFTILTGIIYPVLVTLAGNIFFHDKSIGSLIIKDGNIVGSRLIGQKFDSAIYFSGRPSATDYSAMPSGGSNYGLTSRALHKDVESRIYGFRSFNNLDTITTIPSEMLFESGSGLDPHISAEAAWLQINRVSKARHLDSCRKAKVESLIAEFTSKPQLRFLGNERVNVLLLNLAIDSLK
jgi:potassium-transporting ATPase KdpC subunit